MLEKKNDRIGIVGGGQLGRMLTFAAKKLGFHVVILDPTPNSPAGQVADGQIIGSFTDEDKIRELAYESDFLTFEIELANAKVLEEIIAQGITSVNPSPKTLHIIKDKLKQKEFLRKHGIPTAEFYPVGEQENSNFDIRASDLKELRFPFFLKARTDAYDGRGNALVTDESTLEKGLQKLSGYHPIPGFAGRKLYIEKFVPFTKELAVMVARNTIGEIAVYPVVETTHKNNICHTVVVPAPISEAIAEKAKKLAIQVVEHLEGGGVFGIEMFLTHDDQVLINEIAPRVHNSGHYTIEACETSQFEQHIRAITGMPLGSTKLTVPAAAMVNILGERHGKARLRPAKRDFGGQAKNIAGVEIHIYGKIETRVDRKMGHITAVGNTAKEALKKALMARKYISI